MLKMEVAIPAPQPLNMDFDFNDTRPMPFLSVPSSPKRFGDYSLSAPTSPSRMAEFYHSFDEESRGVPFDWEERPGTPKSGPSLSGEDDFAFDVSGELHNPSLTADELFDGGKIRPLKPPPRLQVEDSINQRSPLLSPRSPIAQGKKILRDAFSPKKKKNSDPFAAAVENTRKTTGNERGRDRVSATLVSSSSRRAARSVSPLRVSEYPWEEEKEKQHQEGKKQSELNSKPSFSSKGSSRKWRLKDFLFRSASEGRASDKDPYRNFPALFRKHEDVKDASFRSTDSSSGSKRRGHVSAHELHYTVNKAASQDLKKKTFLPYKQGILGRLAFNPAVHALANGFGTLTH